MSITRSDLGLRDLKYLRVEQQQREIRQRCLWLATGALLMLALLVALGIPGRMDYEDALRVERLERDRLQAQKVRTAYNEGWQSGARSVACVGLRLDARTGEAIK